MSPLPPRFLVRDGTAELGRNRIKRLKAYCETVEPLDLTSTQR